MPLRKDIKKVLVIGSGPIVIGQAAEFDYAGTQACLALRDEGIEVVLVNSNPATIMTDDAVADRVYIEPLTVESIEKIIRKERPDGLIGTLGGQTGLNLTVQLHEQNILAKYDVQLLGSPVEAIQKGEDREQFRQLMMDIGEPVPDSQIVHNVEEGFQFAREIGYPVIIRPAYTLGGAGGGFAENDEELEALLKKGLRLSPIHQVLLEKSIKGWKEIEFEVMRDANDTCITVCSMENMDPVGVHTGDSIVVAPAQTLTNTEYQMLRNASLKVIRALGVIGGCNIQFALDPHSNQYYIIEVNPRVSRSSALASKATGYPIARMAAKCAAGYHLDEVLNPVTGHTYASFEPAIDYVVVKLPRFPFDKFPEADRTLGTQMKATGEVMAIDRSFEGALNKGLRSLEMKVAGLKHPRLQQATQDDIIDHLRQATDLRLFAIAEGYRRGLSTEEIWQFTMIDLWFLEKIKGLVAVEKELEAYTWPDVPDALLKKAKQYNMADAYLADLYGVSEREVRQRRKSCGLKPGFKSVDTCAGEFEAETPYYYSTWRGEDEVGVSAAKKVLVIGSGPIRIGQGIEFDYCSVHAALALKKKGYEAIVINNNPETVSTDYAVADKLYFEPLAVEDILHVIDKEQVEGVLIQFGGQTAINVAQALAEEGVPLLGTSLEAIDALEDRDLFYQLLHKLNIPHIEGKTVHHAHELKGAAQDLGFPVLVRPSYVIGGQAMFVFYREDELEAYVRELELDDDQRMWPLLVDKYLPGLECEVDVLSDGQHILIPGILEHIEKAGVHSGDSVTIFPPLNLNEATQSTLVDYARRIAQEMRIVGLMNIQFVINDGKVHVLEVNPRASRTVPIMSKVTQMPLVEWAAYLQLGDKLSDMHAGGGLLPEPNFYAVKAPVFSNAKLNDVDDALGPEMKSTGEILGLGTTSEEALAKALFLGEENPLFPQHDKTYILCSISGREKEASLSTIRQLRARSFHILATPGTAQYLQEHGIETETIAKDLRLIDERLKQGRVAALVNIANQGRVKERFGFQLRALARRHQIPCFTCLDTVEMALSLPQHLQWGIGSMTEYTQFKKEVGVMQ